MEILVTILKMFGFAFVAFFVSTIIHEGGHVIAGLVQGWRFSIMVIGPVTIYRDMEDDKIKIKMEKNPALWGGLGGTYPKEKSDRNIRAYARILLAGPAASLLMGGICGILLVFHGSLFMSLLTFVPISMGIACLIPNAKTGFLYTDGGRFLRIVKGGKTAAEERALFEATLLETHTPGEKYDSEGIGILTASAEVSFRYFGHYYAYLNAKKDQDAEEIQKQIATMESIKKDVPKSVQDLCIVDN